MKRSQDAVDTETQAATWVVRLEGEPSAVLIEQWRRWADESARRHAAYVRLANSWQRTDCLRRLRPLDGEVRMDLLDSLP